LTKNAVRNHKTITEQNTNTIKQWGGFGGPKPPSKDLPRIVVCVVVAVCVSFGFLTAFVVKQLVVLRAFIDFQ
jgi:hypothetical protein